MEEGKGERYLAPGRQYGNALLGVRHQEEEYRLSYIDILSLNRSLLRTVLYNVHYTLLVYYRSCRSSPSPEGLLDVENRDYGCCCSISTLLSFVAMLGSVLDDACTVDCRRLEGEVDRCFRLERHLLLTWASF